jgi:nickel-dependent lactate racemase
MEMKFEVPKPIWYGEATTHKLEFPDEWEVEICAMKGSNESPLSNHKIQRRFEHPLGTERISELARGKKEIAIIFDDMSRGTRVHRFIPYILNELLENGIEKDHIRFIMALGAHGARTRIDFVKKLGEDVVSNFAVYNHNPFQNCVSLGKTSRGIPVELNMEVAKCDLKIGIGSIVPHPTTGFGGGSKIILPGVVSMETIYQNHCLAGRYGPRRTLHPSVGLGLYEENIVYEDMEEAAEMAGLDVKIDALLNAKCETTDLFVGDPIIEYGEGVKVAVEHYVTKTPNDVDVVIANAPAKSNEARLAMWTGVALRDGGTMVILADTPEGQVTHYLEGKFGSGHGGRGWQPRNDHPKIGKVIIFSRYKEADPSLPISPRWKLVWKDRWPDVLEEIKKEHKSEVKVAIYPCAEIQYPLGGLPRTALQGIV